MTQTLDTFATKVPKCVTLHSTEGVEKKRFTLHFLACHLDVTATIKMVV